MAKKSRTKGKAGELEAARVFRANGWPDCHRSSPMQAGHADAGYSDLAGTGILSVECKRYRKVPVVRLYVEAEKRALPGFELVLAHRDDNGPWLGTMALDRLALMAAQHRDLRAMEARLKAAFPEVYDALTTAIQPLEVNP